MDDVDTPRWAAVNDATRKLLTAAARLVRVYTVLPAGTVDEVSTVWGRSVAVRTAAPVQVVGWPGLAVPVEAHPVRPGPQVTAGQNLGALTAHAGLGDATTDLRADATLAGPSWWWRLTRSR